MKINPMLVGGLLLGLQTVAQSVLPAEPPEAGYAHEPHCAVCFGTVRGQCRRLRRAQAGGNRTFDYHGSFSPDGRWIVFTSERARRAGRHLPGSPRRVGSEQLTDSPALDDQAVLSPDGTHLAFMSTRDRFTANIWLLNLKTRKLRDLTASLMGDGTSPTAISGRRVARWQVAGVCL